ncbi:MAG: polysaccharide biosynthesis C-terminal domain-containing protein [bacterium]|nr:polysaccharide biosynthesis C-terminal domain-containing protein [bacterium]
MQKRKIVATNMVVTGMYQILTVVFGLVIPRLFLDEYGASLHGLTSTVTNILSYVTLLNAGLLTASVQALYKPLSLKNTEDINSIISAVKKYYNKVGIYYVIVIVLAAFVLPFFVSNQVGPYIAFSVMIAMGLTSIFDSFLGATYRVLAQADQKYWLISLCSIISLIVRSVMQIMLINFHKSVVLVQLMPAMMTILTYIILKSYTKRKYPYLDTTSNPNFEALGQRKAALLHQIAGVVVNNTDTVLLTIFQNLTVVSIYSVYQLVFTHLYSLTVSVFSNSTVASFGHHLVTETKENIRSSFDRYEAMFYIFITCILGTTAAMIAPFVSIYTSDVKGVQYLDSKLILMFMIISIMNTGRVPCGMLINAAGHYRQTQYRALAEAVINFFVSIFLVRKIGIYGVLLGTVISFVYRTFDIIIYSNKHILHRSPLLSIKRFVRTGIVIFFMYFISNIFEISEITNWFRWLRYGVIYFVVSVVLTGMVWSALERNVLKTIFGMIKR